MLQRLHDILLDHEQRDTLLLETADIVEYLRHDARRKAERGLVQHQEARPRHHRARDRQHLLLAARQRACELPAALAEDRKQPEIFLDVTADTVRVAPGRRT